MRIPYRIVEDFDHIFDERDNQFLALRKVVWGEGGSDEDYKLDMRRWGINADGNEGPHKGFSFLTEEGPNELARVLVGNDFGHTEELLEELSKRDDFEESLNNVVGKDSKFYNEEADAEEYYDPAKTDDMFDYPA